MSSSTRRFTRSVALSQRNRTFRTVIDPHEERVQICPIFKSEWKNILKLSRYGWMKFQYGNTYIQIQLFLSGSDSYLTCGRWLAGSFRFKKPTSVNLHFRGLDNHFDMTLIKDRDEDVISISSDDSDPSLDFNSVENVGIEDEYDDNESVGNESEVDDSEVEGYSFGPFQNDGLFGWELKVTPAVASVRKMQVGRIPSEIANGLLLNRDHILMQTPYSDRLIVCEIKTSQRSLEWPMKEKYFTDGWYQFVRRFRPNVGDTMRFQLSDPVEAVRVEIIRNGRVV